MKKKFLILFCIFLITISFAHSGRTDSKGGHYDRSTGEYHYHHGYPAHKVCGTNCPYNNVDKTNRSSTSSTSSKSISTSDNSTTKKSYSIIERILLSLAISFFMHPLFSVANLLFFALILKLLQRVKLLKNDIINYLEKHFNFWYWLGFIESTIFFIIVL